MSKSKREKFHSDLAEYIAGLTSGSRVPDQVYDGLCEAWREAHKRGSREPPSATIVSERAGISRRSASEQLVKLAESGRVVKKRVGRRPVYVPNDPEFLEEE